MNKGAHFLERNPVGFRPNRCQFTVIRENELVRLDQDWDFVAQFYFWRIKAGYEIDGATVPWPFWSLTYRPTSPVVIPAAFKHDIFCEVKPEGTDSAIAAADFKQDVIEAGGSKRRAERMRWAIAEFGPTWGPTRARLLHEASLDESMGDL